MTADHELVPMFDTGATVVGVVEDPPALTRTEAVAWVMDAYGSAVAGIVEAGRRLIALKDSRERGAWLDLFEGEGALPFTVRTAQYLMDIAAHPSLANANHGSNLPTAWTTLRELARLEPDDIVSRIESGELTPDTDRRTVKSWIRAKVDPPAALPAGDLAPDLRVGDFRDVLTDITPDVVLTDPPYPREYLPLYADLAKWAADVLPADGLLAVMCGQSYLPELLQLMSGPLPYRWTVAHRTPGPAIQVWQPHVTTQWKPVLIFGHTTAARWIVCDVTTADGPDQRFHHWGQPVSGFADLVERLTVPGQHIADPFMGAGTTGVAAVGLGRRFTGCDINPEHVETARRRFA